MLWNRPDNPAREERPVQRARPTSGRGTAGIMVVALAATLCGTGCTMCPSPFDYSGTVPGAADQNDFRVRNNGILPIWKRPRPWPPVVSSEGNTTSDTVAVPPPEKASRVIIAATKTAPAAPASSILAEAEPAEKVVAAAHTETAEPSSSGISIAGFFEDVLAGQSDEANSDN